MRHVAALVGLLVAASLAACSREAEAPPRWNVLLFTWDTVRADHVSSYGYGRRTTPNLDALAAEGIRFANAHSQSSFTAPSHASILTARHPTSHGVKWWNYALPEAVETVAEVFAERGYRTGCFTPLALASSNGLGQGFQRVVEVRGDEFKVALDAQNSWHIAPARAVDDVFLKWLDVQVEQGTPFFAWVHYYDAHRPYAAFAPERAFCAEKAWPFGNATGADYQLRAEERARRGIGERHARHLIDRYDSGLLALDAEFGRVVEHLRSRGLLENTMIVVTADHGEAFAEFEEEWFTHDPFLHDAVTHVPLIIRLPDGAHAGRVVEPVVETIDIGPTVLGWLGLPPPQFAQGADLRELIETGRPPKPFALAEKQAQDRDPRDPAKVFTPADVKRLQAMRTATHRLVVSPDELAPPRLYDRRREAHEWTNLFEASQDLLRGMLDAFTAARRRIEALDPKIDPRALSEEERRVLEQNGYL